jgi:hypothetical protein
VIGGIAVSVWARPRATQVIDFKVLLDRDAAQRLLGVLTPDHIPLQANPLQGLQRNGVLFAIDVESLVQRQGHQLDDKYVLHWLHQLELALDDSTLVPTYQRLRRR